MKPSVDNLYRKAQGHLLESAEVKRQVAENCMDSILAAAALIAESFRTSGDSTNIIRAVEAALAADMHTIALTGNGGRLKEMANVAISVPSANTQYIQEAHLAIEHILCELVERHLFDGSGEWR